MCLIVGALLYNCFPLSHLFIIVREMAGLSCGTFKGAIQFLDKKTL